MTERRSEWNARFRCHIDALFAIPCFFQCFFRRTTLPDTIVGAQTPAYLDAFASGAASERLKRMVTRVPSPGVDSTSRRAFAFSRRD